MRLKILPILAILLLFGGVGTASAQRLSVKTNALYWATVTPNLAVELALGPRTTLELGGGYNPFGSEAGRSTRHWLVQSEFRWWFSRRFAGTFIGLHVHGGTFDVGGISPIRFLETTRYDGWLAGGGIGIGRHWLLSARWGIEVQAGFGFTLLEYDKYDCSDCETSVGNRFINNYFGPTRLNLSLVYYLR